MPETTATNEDRTKPRTLNVIVREMGAAHEAALDAIRRVDDGFAEALRDELREREKAATRVRDAEERERDARFAVAAAKAALADLKPGPCARRLDRTARTLADLPDEEDVDAGPVDAVAPAAVGIKKGEKVRITVLHAGSGPHRARALKTGEELVALTDEDDGAFTVDVGGGDEWSVYRDECERVDEGDPSDRRLDDEAACKSSARVHTPGVGGRPS